MSETMDIELMGTIKAEHIRSPLGEGWRVAVDDKEQIITDPQAVKDLVEKSLGLPAEPATSTATPQVRRPRRSSKELKEALRALVAKGVPREKLAGRLRVKPARLDKLLAELEVDKGEQVTAS